MDSLKQFFSYMNEISFKYVVLRNWDDLPYDVVLGDHSDLDLLVYDYDHFFEIFPQADKEYPYPRVRTKIPINDSYIYADIRHVGDEYYPQDFEEAILESREYNARGFYTPDPIHHRIALAYHAVHHKGDISKDYRKYLGDATIKELTESLKLSNIGWSIPKDRTVGRFHPYWKGATSTVSKEDGKIVKTQTSYKSYDLIKNEYIILSNAHSNHFPSVYSMDSNTITIEDCGEPLTPQNIPSDWNTQLKIILNDLKNHNIMHRDIKLDNLLVKGDIIKLIDFGWAKYIGEEESTPPPSCLGYPNKPSTGFSDEYSMRCVSKQIDYMLENQEVVV